MKFAHAIARVLEGMEIWMGRGATFGTGVAAPFVASLPAAGSGAPASLCRGGCDRGIVATTVYAYISVSFTNLPQILRLLVCLLIYINSPS